MADSTPMTRRPSSRAATSRRATAFSFSGSPTEGPPNFITPVPARGARGSAPPAWVGFDTAEILALLSTVIGIYRRAVWVEVAAAVAGTLLVADAWFDVLLSAGDEKVWIAIVQAAFAELPLSFLCFWIALDVAR